MGGDSVKLTLVAHQFDMFSSQPWCLSNCFNATLTPACLAFMDTSKLIRSASDSPAFFRERVRVLSRIALFVHESF